MFDMYIFLWYLILYNKNSGCYAYYFDVNIENS